MADAACAIPSDMGPGICQTGVVSMSRYPSPAPRWAAIPPVNSCCRQPGLVPAASPPWPRRASAHHHGRHRAIPAAALPHHRGRPRHPRHCRGVRLGAAPSRNPTLVSHPRRNPTLVSHPRRTPALASHPRRTRPRVATPSPPVSPRRPCHPDRPVGLLFRYSVRTSCRPIGQQDVLTGRVDDEGQPVSAWRMRRVPFHPTWGRGSGKLAS